MAILQYSKEVNDSIRSIETRKKSENIFGATEYVIKSVNLPTSNLPLPLLLIYLESLLPIDPLPSPPNGLYDRRETRGKERLETLQPEQAVILREEARRRWKKGGINNCSFDNILFTGGNLNH
ncbi:hypothetical protein PRIPAC_74070 [Pristionchus pacificus]|uniref:Uncharacterized protein n=1 Tax=Pristionchus pacificus TaxID=54126 RepID=A0A2A6BFW4_PRIPA|nr:hypothetical protein PRIPAC_74070 [Pristionchus pacificus]|eukprot:PDM64784.1 hypothetical protein PRIPAC_53040 [Pristionchus pacificus]